MIYKAKCRNQNNSICMDYDVAFSLEKNVSQK